MMKTKTKKTTRINPRPPKAYDYLEQPENIEAVHTVKCFHVITNQEEHYFAHSKSQLLNYIGKKTFETIAVIVEDVPTSIAYR